MEKTYSIDQIPFGKFTEFRLVNKNNGSYVSVVPDLGAVLNQVTLFANGTLHELLVGSASYDELVTEGLKWYKGSKLLPFPNRINKGTYEFNGKTYQVPMNETARQCALHGLVVDKPFTVVSSIAEANSAKLVVSYEFDGSHEGYPFKYSAKITYELNDKGFSCTTSLSNKDDKDLPIGDGVHPYFKTGSSIDSWLFKIPKCQILDVDDRLIPTLGVKIFDKYENSTQFGDQKFDSCFALNVTSTQENKAAVEIVDEAKGIKLAIWQETGVKKYNYIQIYTPDDRKSMAIEPMTCAPDAFNNKLGLLVLKPAENVEFTWGITLSDLAH